MAYIGQTPTAVALDGDDLANDIITLAKMASGTDGNIISYDASGNPVAIATGSDGQVLTSTGAGSAPAFEALPAGSTLGSEQATTTGDTITFGSIPSGVKMILLCFNGVSNGGVDLLVRLGDGGGIETSGYVGGSTILITDNSITGGSGTTGFVLKGDNDANIHTGIVTMVNIDSTNHDWVMNYSGIAETNHTLLGGATKSLSAELTQLDVNIASGAFDAGSMNILYF